MLKIYSETSGVALSLPTGLRELYLPATEVSLGQLLPTKWRLEAEILTLRVMGLIFVAYRRQKGDLKLQITLNRKVWLAHWGRTTLTLIWQTKSTQKG